MSAQSTHSLGSTLTANQKAKRPWHCIYLFFFFSPWNFCKAPHFENQHLEINTATQIRTLCFTCRVAWNIYSTPTSKISDIKSRLLQRIANLCWTQRHTDNRHNHFSADRTMTNQLRIIRPAFRRMQREKCRIWTQTVQIINKHIIRWLFFSVPNHIGTDTSFLLSSVSPAVYISTTHTHTHLHKLSIFQQSGPHFWRMTIFSRQREAKFSSECYLFLFLAADGHVRRVLPSGLNGHWFKMKSERRCDVNEFHTPVSLKTLTEQSLWLRVTCW